MSQFHDIHSSYYKTSRTPKAADRIVLGPLKTFSGLTASPFVYQDLMGQARE